MVPFSMAHPGPVRMVPAQAPRTLLPRQELQGVGVVNKADRANLISITTGLAMAGGGVYALLNVPGTKKIGQIALGTLGGALVLTGLLNVYDGLA